MVELKYYIFFLGTGLALLLAVWAAASEKITKWVFAGFLLSTMYMVDINFMSHEWYRGSTRGFEFSTSDLLLIVMLGSVLVRHCVRNQSGIRLQWLPAGSIPFLAFIAIAALSLSKAEQPLYGLFELSKLVKGYLIFWSICNLTQGPDFRRVAFGVFCLMAIGEIAYGAFQHFNGRFRIPGTLGHPNSYAMYLNMLLPILLAVAIRTDWRKAFLLFGVIGGGVAAVILTFSRGGWLALGLAFALVMILSMRQEFSIRTLVVIGLAISLSLGVMVKAFPLMLQRVEGAPEVSLYWRLKMNQAGYLMVSQSPWLGIGINNSVAWIANKEKVIEKNSFSGIELFNRLLGSLQLSEEKLEQEIEAITYFERGSLIHNIYIVTGAETGVLGLTAFLLLGARLLWIGGKMAMLKQDAERSIWFVGIFGGLVAVYLQGFAEWELRQTPLWYLFCSLAGLLVSQLQSRRFSIQGKVAESVEVFAGESSCAPPALVAIR